MNFKKRVNGSWTDTPHYIHKTDTDTLTTLPDVVYVNDTTVTVGLKGNMEQIGTPTSSDPIQPQETGERTGNLWNNGDVTIALHERYKGIPISLEQGTYTLSFEYKSVNTGNVTVIFYNESTIIQTFNITITNDKGNVSITSEQPITTIKLYSASGYTPSYDYAAEYTKIMLNLGSEALPYENFGYKIPISSGGENLWDEMYAGISTSLIYLPLYVGNGEFTLSTSTPSTSAGASLFLLSGNVSSGASTSNNGVSINVSRTVSSIDGYITVAYRVTSDISPQNYQTMLNLGATALPYEPYVQPTLSNIYLGEAQTTRRIKKLVLTGEETSYMAIDTSKNIFSIRGVFNQAPELLQVGGFCTHYKYNNAISSLAQNMSNGDFVLNKIADDFSFTIRDNSFSNDTDFKQYVQQQYSAGTPVCVWYVLATPETAVVNEPLRKIGDYADEVSGITIPTIAGANTISVGTTLQPSEVSVNYKGWHPVADVHEAENGQWD